MANEWQALQGLLQTPELPELGPGPRKGREALPQLEQQVRDALKGSEISDTNQQLIRAGILLWHDHLDASHTISQSIENADGSYLHGIMHRREPDYWNSKYWFRRVGKHACFGRLAKEAAGLLAAEPSLASKLAPKEEWDPYAFVDECERVASLPREDKRVRLLREVQGLELRILIEYLCA